MRMIWRTQDEQDRVYYAFIFIVTLLRVLTTRVIACPPDFDCNAYIHMANHLAYDPAILPHHAMRILPSFLAHLIEMFGLSLPMAFRILADCTYVFFGYLLFWVLRQNAIKPIMALSFSLLCLAPHHAMRIPLQNVYQLCDLMTYPLSLLLLHFSLRLQHRIVFLLALIGLVIKQTVFGFGGLALLYCFFKNKRVENIVFIAMLSLGYLALQQYYHAFSIMTTHLIPQEGFFSATYVWGLLNDSKLIDLFIPILPFLIVYFKQVILFLLRSWHVALYIGIIISQPLIAYHLTGNNFQRLALQGVWLIYFIIGLSTAVRQLPKSFEYCFLVYCASIYFTWGMPQRMILMISFMSVCIILMIPHLCLILYKKRSFFSLQNNLFKFQGD